MLRKEMPGRWMPCSGYSETVCLKHYEGKKSPRG
jgi:hypothetical protein